MLKHPLIFALASLAWFIFRVGTKPSRITYPCQKVALFNISWLFPFVGIPFLTVNHNNISKSFTSPRTRTWAKNLVIIAAFLAGLFLIINPARKQPSVKNQSNTGITEILPLATDASQISTVSVRYDPSSNYSYIPPYDQKSNSAYNLVWKTVGSLGLGSSDNPLKNLINEKDSVLIKVNLLGDKPGMYTHPAVVRPLIDMCIKAGAKNISVGDAGPSYTHTTMILERTGYKKMVELLQDLHPGIKIQIANLCNIKQWRWINLGSNSSFSGSGYKDSDLADANGTSLYRQPYYLAADPKGINPQGKCMGWYAISNYVLNASVIINAAKMKCHDYMINTLSLKNIVGITMPSTFTEYQGTVARIPHVKTDPAFDPAKYETSFGNDIFWRSCTDLNKIVLYADKNSILKPEKQRKYLNVIDAIEGSERNQYGKGASGGDIYKRNCVIAGVDPVAVDAVASRIMRYDWRVIPLYQKIATKNVHSPGTNDPEKIFLVGDEVNEKFNYLFGFNMNWREYAKKKKLDISDLIPPTIDSVNVPDGKKEVAVSARVTDASVCFLCYEKDGKGYIKKMERKGSNYYAALPGLKLKYQVQAQDKYFNTVRSPIHLGLKILGNDWRK